MSSDMTIESALADPMIRALMRADRVEPQAFERFLRSAARSLDVEPQAMSAPVWASRPAPSGRRSLCCA